MRYFEAEFPIRHVDGHNTNDYAIHQQVEKVIAGDQGGDKIKTPYVFDYHLNHSARQAIVTTRTMQPTGLPGERQHDTIFHVGQTVMFGLHFVPMMNLTEGNKRNVYMHDKTARLTKVIDRLEGAGIEAVMVDEIEEVRRQFRKKNHAFFIKSARYAVEGIITEPALFEVAFTRGIGPKISFGYGKIQLLGGWK